MSNKKRLATFVAAIVLMFSAMTLSSPATHAVGCYGDWCSGRDADATGCSADAVTTQVYNNKEFSLQVRWSPTCKTNWARIVMYSPGWIKCTSNGYLKAVQDTGYTQQIFFDTVCAAVSTVHYNTDDLLTGPQSTCSVREPEQLHIFDTLVVRPDPYSLC